MGEIITFYSYKGGTGRTMALANVACLLAERSSRKKGVLMIDWDLEAPGLHRFFRNRFKNYFEKLGKLERELEKHVGLIDLFLDINDLIRQIEASSIEDDEELASILSKGINIDKYIIKTDVASLYLLTAGRQDCDYQDKVRKFPWEELYNLAPQLFLSIATMFEKQYEGFDLELVDDALSSCVNIFNLYRRFLAYFSPN